MQFRTKIKTIFLFGLLGFSVNTFAEIGDYSVWETLRNLVSPPKADNPVTPDQQNEPLYPLLSNPEGFEDGFTPSNYLGWQTVQLHPDTGAVCGNGSPYKFFINRVAHSSNMVLYMEGGGACWDYPACTGQTGIRGARNPNGIPDDYMSLMNPGSSLVSPFVVRLHPWSRTKAQEWNMVYLPYCTGDTYTGDSVAVYDDPTGENPPLVWHHNGAKNLRAVIAWLKNNLQKPGQMLMTGCSAGGTGSLAHYYPTRQDMEPTRSFLINDSGPIYPAVVGDSPENYPSLHLHAKIREAWGLDADDEGPLNYLQGRLNGFELDNLGTIYGALAEEFPNDRMGHTQFWEDLNYSSYSYEQFFDDIFNEPDQEVREQRIHQRWYQDTNSLMAELSNYDNIGYYVPRYRAVNESHCSTIIEFTNGDIQEDGLELDDFVDNVMNGEGAVMQESEDDTVSDFEKPFNLIYWLLDQLIAEI